MKNMKNKKAVTSEIVKIKIDKIRPHPDNPNKMSKIVFDKLVKNIKTTKLYEPIIVRKNPKRKGFYQLINGYHRLKALKKIGAETANCIVWDVDDQQVDLLLMTLNRLCGSDVLSKKIHILKRLTKAVSTKQLSKMLPNGKTQIEQLINLKMPTKLLMQSQSDFAIPMVFFVTEGEKEKIEQALAIAAIDKTEKIKQKRNAKALVVIAKEFLKNTNRIDRKLKCSQRKNRKR